MIFGLFMSDCYIVLYNGELSGKSNAACDMSS